ncbi:Acyl-CoA synthetase (AMP-forming)/AMP-acid ligase II [Pseudonocardia ammonioxydans]|uniref:Acyl-CoA synthetase (AMP-forming)/AMP-acid ligase II n=1 Tax=Pseudonocardia ammonioxydans TaxID=260086 RepID=A0A1I5BTI4_PSUAM|nr:AMP-binding protein [Pseudonocardia ammonioxydans]SFN77973.1 Acyl-CoA synthetase (AMP-forming)/AMP-acid ligase II [Pseudonocardia ammonioxydans]
MAASPLLQNLSATARTAYELGSGTARAAVALTRSGVVRPLGPGRLYGMGRALLRYGHSVAAAYSVGAARHPYRLAVVDDHGLTTYAELDERTDRLGLALLDSGAGPGAPVGILCRNSAAPVEVLVAAGKVGADVVLVNTGLSAEQLRGVQSQQQLHTIVADPEFRDVVPDGPRLVLTSTPDGPRAAGGRVLDDLELMVARGGPGELPFRPPRSKQIVLTSGTTGTPKGAKRPHPSTLAPAASILSAMPLRAGETVHIAAPLFHTWGNAGLLLAALHGSTVVLRRRFTPEGFLAAVTERRADTVFAVPVMLQRLLESDATGPAGDWGAEHTPRVVAVSGSALPGGQAVAFMDRFGDNLYNLYGSTEVSWVSIAGPDDLRDAPGTAGRAPAGTTLVILDEQDRPAGPGVEGRVFVGNDLPFEGYTGGEAGLEERDGLLGTGDVGHLDEQGRLFLTGRADDMIVSGGENVHPGPVEDLISGLDGVREACVLGVDDHDFGQRLAAWVVTEPGADLTADTIRDRVKSDLATFAVPRDVHFLDELPRNQTGKVLRKQLPGRS